MLIAALVSCANPIGDSAEGKSTQAFTPRTLLSSGLTKCKLRFGGAPGVGGMLGGNRLVATEAVGDHEYHGECQIAGLLGVDFEIRSRLRFDQGSTADIQFRVSNEGRYGARFEAGWIRLYAFTYPWANPVVAGSHGGVPMWREIDKVPLTSLVAEATHDVTVRGVGGAFSVSVAGHQVLSAQDHALPAGRFGIYTLSASSNGGANFDTFEVVGDPTLASNRTLLYSTTGYERLGTKRALVRTLSRDDGQVAGTFTLLGAADGLSKYSGNLSHENDTFGMQLWSADFSEFDVAGRYRLRVNMSAFGSTPWNDVLTSAPFDIATDNLSRQVLTKLSVLNGEARRAADEDLRSNWTVVSGRWSVTDEGAFVTVADASSGSLLDRVGDGYGKALGGKSEEFTLSGELTVLSGCDAGLQFFTNSGSRYMVTLMMQSSGPCQQYPGPGAVRLSREGSAVPDPDHWQVLKFVPYPLQSGLKYDVELRVARDGANTQSVTVRVNKHVVIEPFPLPDDGPRLSGDFALRAFAATARFDRVRAWHADVPFWFPENGERIALDPRSEAKPRPWSAPPGGPVPNRAPTCEERSDEERNRVPEGGDHTCYPIFTMRHGYHDCNNYIGEATSHGAFLAGLMDVWVRRRGAVGEEALRRAILTTDAYLADLFRHAGSSGEFVHMEPGRGAAGTSGIANTLLALLGESAFAAKGAAVDLPRARDACRRTVTGIRWLEREDAASSRRFNGSGPVWYDDYKSIIYANASQCMQRTGLTSNDLGLTDAYLQDQAYISALRLAKFLSTNIEEDARYSLRINPALAGIEAVLATRLRRGRRGAILAALGFTTPRSGLVAKLSSKIWRKNSPLKLTSMGFNVIPQSAGREPKTFGFPYSPQDVAAFNKSLWDDTASVPPIENQDLAKGPDGASLNPKLQWYIVSHFASSTSDAAILYSLRPADSGGSESSVDRDLEALGAGSLGWITGLNPGLPRTKIVNDSSDDIRPWGSAAFIVNAGVPSARGFSYMPLESKKTWPFPEEGPGGSPWRERWWINPSQNGFATVVNGHMIWDGEWDYWNQGEHGWVSGETFLLHDGGVLSGMLRYEDAVNARPVPVPPSPNTSRPVWRDTTADERAETGWFFNDVNTVWFARASRMAHEYCTRRGFASGHPTGHQIGSNIGVVCFPSVLGAVEDVTDYQVANSGNGFGDIDSAPWAQVSRAARVLCTKRYYKDEASGGVSHPHVSGVFTGHEIAGGPTVRHRRGLACLRRDAGTFYNSTWQEHYDSGQGFVNVDTEHWAKASRAATNMCMAKGHPLGGFFTGVQVGPGTDPTTKGLICYVQ